MHCIFDTAHNICKNIHLLASSLNFQFRPMQFTIHRKYKPELTNTAFILSDKLNLESEQMTTLDER